MSESIQQIAGYVDFYGFSATAGGWLVTGWIVREWEGTDKEAVATLDFGARSIGSAVQSCTFERADVQKVGIGVLLLVETTDGRPGTLSEAVLNSGQASFRLAAPQSARVLDEAALLDRCRDLLMGAARTALRADLLRRLNRPRFDGRDTVVELSQPVFLELDAIYICPPHGVLLRGWFADPFGVVAKIRLRCPGSAHIIDPAQWIRIPRPDVVNALSERVGTVDRAPGFLAYVSPMADPSGALVFEVETQSGQLAFKRAAGPIRTGIVAIREILGVFELRHQELARGFDAVVGPAIASLNQQRLRVRPHVNIIAYGTPSQTPRASIIVPLYGRMDFLEYQLGLFHRTLAPDHELIYVLDDPDRARELEALAASCHAKFQRSFTILSLSHNMGYAPANNVGLQHARAPHVCFLNSDVFPCTPDWLEIMLRAAAEAGVGAVGALLVFEDGTVQHEGIAYSSLHEFGGWSFSLHPNKGRHPVASAPSAREVDAVTGACLLMPTGLARELGGFDEGFVIGDFEDVDLCKQVQARGLRCVVDRRARLYHLERQSQGDQQLAWRTNLTLFNAWRFERKWGQATARVRSSI